MMKFIKFTFLMIIVSTVIFSCKNDDDNAVIQVRDRAEQQIEDDAELVEFLNTHFYNYDEFDFTNPDGAVNDTFQMTFGKIEGANAGRTPLSSQVETRTITYFDVEYTYYVLKLRQGGGKSYSNADAVSLTYRGQILDLSTFDIRLTQQALGLVSTVKGFQVGVAEFNAAEDIVEGTGGFLNARNGGIGAVFFPSGLGYFGTFQTGIPTYSQLIFSFNIFDVQFRDDDADGILSSMEDLDGDDEVTNDDTDGDGVPNFLDPDDDADGTPTVNEIVQNTYVLNPGDMEPVLAANEVEKTRDTDDAGVTTITTVVFTDTDGDGTPDYLDAN
ncbi:hypothetical protein [uncultured Kordia sp.]|uniref:FKBP-type peptidyl-prolyl cis-trans isomerase n=1 Tax=uncultured Kordia sp. TaxID=507699 RepID=UPI00261B8F5E|nr:hypothetical protein [uncultured Kordia sp.]